MFEQDRGGDEAIFAEVFVEKGSIKGEGLVFGECVEVVKEGGGGEIELEDAGCGVGLNGFIRRAVPLL